VPEAAAAVVQLVPDPEVDAKPTRRSFTADCKLRILREIDTHGGETAIGAALRREGLYSSHLGTWQKQRDTEALRALG
jgi:hypothetical protein